MHFFRRSKIHLDCFTSRADVVEYAPIVSGSEVLPDWWKALPKQANIPHPMPTMKTCVGVYDYYNKSVAMPLWSDLYVAVKAKEYSWQFSDLLTKAVVHAPHQYTGFLDSNYGHLKIASPWQLSTKQSLNWVATAPIYNRTSFDDFTFGNGILDFSKQRATNIQMLIHLRHDREFLIPFKTMFMFTPMTDKDVVIHRHLVSAEEFSVKEAASATSTFINKYKAHEKAPKCPFHNHVGAK